MEEVKLLVDDTGNLFVQFPDGQIGRIDNYYDIIKVWNKYFPDDKEKPKMSMYGEDGSTGYAKEDVHYAMEKFLEDHEMSELLEILANVASIMEWQRAKDDES